MEKCKTFGVASKYMDALKYGYPVKAAEYLKDVYKLAVREITDCVKPCKVEDYFYPTCCRLAYLSCGNTLLLGDTDEFKEIIKPEHGRVIVDDGIVYMPFGDYEGPDRFVFVNGGRRVDVCVVVGKFEPSINVEPFGNLVRRTVVTDCDAEYYWDDGSNSSSRILAPKEPYSVRVVCEGCVEDFTECLTCTAFFPLFRGNIVIKDVVGFDGESDIINKAPLLIIPDIQTALNERDEGCGEPVVTLIEDSVLTITNGPALISHVTFDSTALGGYPSLVGGKLWLGGECYPRRDFEVRWSTSYPKIDELVFNFGFMNEFAFTDNDLSDINNWSVVAGEIKSYISNWANVGDVSIKSQNNEFIMTISETNASIGRAVFENDTEKVIATWSKV